MHILLKQYGSLHHYLLGEKEKGEARTTVNDHC